MPDAAKNMYSRIVTHEPNLVVGVPRGLVQPCPTVREQPSSRSPELERAPLLAQNGQCCYQVRRSDLVAVDPEHPVASAEPMSPRERALDGRNVLVQDQSIGDRLVVTKVALRNSAIGDDEDLIGNGLKWSQDCGDARSRIIREAHHRER